MPKIFRSIYQTLTTKFAHLHKTRAVNFNYKLYQEVEAGRNELRLLCFSAFLSRLRDFQYCKQGNVRKLFLCLSCLQMNCPFMVVKIEEMYFAKPNACFMEPDKPKFVISGP